ncbi:DUF305 domain-containing protein [Streptosporangium sp. 'caverna']|uniref:DUF305 domain-containing protein n=1 Tax=Streptosporangium sp. 'caverna' TaxID=2202249 RepID=UPI000D7D9A06|nr:DUF305 domain-containing protein [Streptosporangium sp. 'caverna']AWS47116.1 DUF305 domain-containing protein [Streptosporangium sp. 'caverna']
MKAATIGVPVLVILTVVLVARCVAVGPAEHTAGSHLPPPGGQATISAPTGTTGTAPAGTASSSFNPTDIAWLQLMIPMTEQAQRLLELAPTKTSNPRLTRFAADNVADRRTTLQRLRDLLRRSGVPESNEHEGHDIPGMVIPADFALLNRAEGAAFDRLFTKDAREYLTQSALVARGEQKSGADQDTKAFAATLEKTYTAQLAQLEP